LLGIALGTAVPMIFVQVFIQPWYALRTVAMPPARYLHEAFLGPGLVAAVVLGICAVLRPWQHDYSIEWLILSVSWQSTLFLALAWRLGLTSEERTQLAGHVRQVLFPAQPPPSC
jgi:hypothetical protein